MRNATCVLQSESPYGQSRYYADECPELEKENKRAYEERTWRNRMHVTDDGRVFIPGSAFKHALDASIQRLGIQIPGRGKMNYTKSFHQGVMVAQDLELPLLAADVQCVKLFVPSDGMAGGSKRVTKYFPRIPAWSGSVSFTVVDDAIPPEVFAKVLTNAGLLVGIGFYRPERRGTWGRFSVKSITWSES